MHMSQASWSGDGLIVALTRLWVASTHAPTKRDGVLLCRFRSSAPQGACGAGRLPPTSVLGPGSEVSYIVMLVAPTGDYEGSNWPQMICTGGGGPYASPIADEPERFDAAAPARWSPYCWGGRSRNAAGRPPRRIGVGVGRPRTAAPAPPRRGACGRGSPVSLGRVLEHVDVQRLLGTPSFEPGVFPFQLREPFLTIP